MRKTKNKLINILQKYAGKEKAMKISLQPLSASTSYGNGKILTYIQLSKYKIKRTEEVVKGRVYIDFDRRNDIVGIEIL